ncbi:minor tail protein [Gordonia phage EricDab]|uniref:Minor tail protein n=1 Tax=Gordonia phage EricDab TaxID=3070616 RepID=A0A4D6E504_9CAUD|nr:minor tail protein [Gordonia phage EricDab]QBZ73182.1 minor tail protein [Gordonia phage EricDab]
MAIDIAAGVRAVIAELETAGIAAYDSPAKVNPPCAYVQPTKLDGFTLGDCAELTVQVFLCAPANSAEVVEPMLGTLLNAALGVLDPTEPVTLNATLALDVGQVPCYIVTASTDT